MILLGLLLIPYTVGVVYNQPEQIHLSYEADVSEIIVTWSTQNQTNSSIVEYGVRNLKLRAFGFSSLFTDGGDEHRKQYIHRVTLLNLQSGGTYYYHCGSDESWSPVFFFKAALKSLNWSPSFAVYGDLGNENAQSLPRLQEETQKGMYDAILHVGDFAYDMDTDNGRVGDQFMRQIESIAAYVPYLTSPGNHEQAYNFSHYKARFSMPGLPDNMFFSYDIGPAHIISLNTEYYYYLNYGLKSFIFQYMWLEEDLKNANKPENRLKHPWIITFGHKPMYCSNKVDSYCTVDDEIIRNGLPMLNKWGLEKLFCDYGVDLEIWAHQHSYERLWPIYNGTVYNGSIEFPYTNPKAPVHIVTGSAGCNEFISPFVDHPPSWSAFRSKDYGYTRLKVFNSTHLYFEQVSDDKNGEVIDKVWLIKEIHGSYS